MPNTGVKVTAQQFNTEVVDTFNELWADKYQTVTIDTDNYLHSFGWGQVEVPSVLKEDIIEAEDTNLLFAKMNAGLMHQYDDILVTLLHKAPGIPVTLDYAQQNGYTTETDNTKDLTTRIAELKTDGERFEAAPNSLSLDLTSTGPYMSGGVLWNNEYEVILRASWPSYADARHFFNSGGRLTVHPDSIDGTSRPWRNLFKSINHEVDITANVMFTTGWNKGYYSSGFYGYGTDEQTPQNDGFNEVFFAMGGDSANTGEYGEYGGEYGGEYYNSEYRFRSSFGWAAEYDEEVSEYGGREYVGAYSAYQGYGDYQYRKFSIWLKAVEGIYDQNEVLVVRGSEDYVSNIPPYTVPGYSQGQPGERFHLLMKIRLEDTEQGGSFQFDENLQIDTSYMLPIVAPNNAFSPANFIVNGVLYQFAERVPPVVRLHKTWYKP